MNKFILCLTLFITLHFASRAQLTENFADGNFTLNPTWTGNTDSFIVNPALQLQSNAEGVAAIQFYLSTPNTLATSAQWEFFVNLKFSTSGVNYVDVFLTASSETLTAGSTTGYFVRIGNTSDEISLYRKDASGSTEIIDGADAIVGSTNNNVRVKVVRDAANQWLLSRDAAGGTNYTNEGFVIDANYTTSAYFGILIIESNAATPRKNHFFDDIEIKAYTPDATPPVIQSSTALSANALDVLFNEPVNSTTASVLTNYSVNNGIGSPTSATVDGSNASLVHLVFAGSFPGGTVSVLTVNGVQDLAGNAINNGTSNFTYFPPYVAKKYDVVIDELMADETPEVGLPANEWIELKNTSASAINLEGWRISDVTSQSGPMPAFTLMPDSFVILCASTNVTAMSAFGTTIPVTGFVGLTNTGEPLVLTSNDGSIIHSIKYDLSWYKDDVKRNGGWTLEMINTESPCVGAINWRASNDPKGGTPGAKNSVDGGVPDLSGPQILNAIVNSNQSITLAFNESLDSAKAATLANYSISDGIGQPHSVVVTTPGFDTVTLSLASTLVDNKLYTITLTTVTDCIGNIISNGTSTFTYFIPVAAQKFDVVIDEIMADETPQVGLPGNEWIELRNTSASPINLLGWRLTDATGQSGTMPDFTLRPDSFVIICSSTSLAAMSALGTAISVTSFPSLINDGEDLALISNDGRIIHSLRYSSSWYQNDSKEDGGWTLEMVNPGNPCTGAANWKASEDPKGGTPGAINSVDGGNPDESGPQLLTAFAEDSVTITLVFSEILDSTSAATMANYTVSDAIGNPGSASPMPPFDRVKIGLNTPLVLDKNYTITVNGLTDCIGNAIGTANTATVSLPSPAARFDIVINEILFNAKAGSAEFVELYNRSNKTIDLKDLFIANDTASPKQITTTGYILQPGDFVVLSADELKVKANYIALNPTKFINVPGMPALSNEEGNVILMDASGNIIDQINYNADWHFKLIDNEQGVSLERINYNDTTLDAALQEKNWHSAASNVGYGTPTYKNSQFMADQQVQGDIVISPEIFSPDNDGTDDFATVTYNFPEPGYVASITIFDASGRPVRYLQRNALLGTKGSFRWDGLGDKNQKLAIGTYIIYTEVFNLQGKTKKFKDPIVLARRY